MTIEIKPVPGHFPAAIGWERWPGGFVLWLGPWYLHADLERRLALADAVIQAAVDSPYSLDCATFAAIQAYRAAAPVAGEVAA